MISLMEWGKTEVVATNGLYTESEHSKVVNVIKTENVSNTLNSKIYVILTLRKRSGQK